MQPMTPHIITPNTCEPFKLIGCNGNTIGTSPKSPILVGGIIDEYETGPVARSPASATDTTGCLFFGCLSDRGPYWQEEYAKRGNRVTNIPWQL